ncbi:hypothetical protein [Deinococcus yavapaiensis]|nr:hypothetical protein [Deinococcus yavapaiensis]
MRTVVLTVALAALAASSLAAQDDGPTAGVSCSVASSLDYDTYSLLLIARAGGWGVGWSEAAEDDASATWADCRASALDARLKNSPNLRARLHKIRDALRTLRSYDGELGAYYEGGGSLYGHAVPRSYVDIEELLGSAAYLASNKLGGELVANGAAVTARYERNLAARLKAWRTYKPDPDLGEFAAKPSSVREAAGGYEKTTRALVTLLGNRPDNVTLLIRDFANTMMFFDEQGRADAAAGSSAGTSARTSGKRASLPCDVAVNVARDAFITLEQLHSPSWTDADTRAALAEWATCQRQAVAKSLSGNPSLLARMNRLRTLLMTFRAHETRLSRLAKERGPEYATSAWKNNRIETLVMGTASLARTTFGGQSFQNAGARMAALRGDFQARLAGLRAMKFTDEMKKRGVTAAQWNAAIDAWAKSYADVVALVGTRPDNATLTVHQYLDESVDADSIEWY